MGANQVRGCQLTDACVNQLQHRRITSIRAARRGSWMGLEGIVGADRGGRKAQGHDESLASIPWLELLNGNVQHLLNPSPRGTNP